MTGHEFREIGLSGGVVTIETMRTEQGMRQRLGFSMTRPVRSAVWGIWAIPPGNPIAFMPFGGIGDAMPPRPHPYAFPVYMPSDSEGFFGRQCPTCRRYWRDEGVGVVAVCPYCGDRFGSHFCVTEGQMKYIQAYVTLFAEAADSEVEGTYTLNMDEVAETVSRPNERPSYFFAEEAQQNKFQCKACGGTNDILGTTGYCARCGTRNDVEWLERTRLADIRQRLHSGHAAPSDCLRDTVSAFDSTVRQLVQQLVRHVPLVPARRSALEVSYHSLDKVVAAIASAFGIDLVEGLPESDRQFAVRMFHRRHVYEHNGGIVDEKYLADTGDSVRLGQALSEDVDSVQRQTELVARMVRNFVAGFHQLVRPRAEPISWEQEKQKRMEEFRSRQGRNA